MPKYIAKRFRFQNGEHCSVLKGPDGLPIHAVTLFLERFRKLGRAANTIHFVCQCIALLYRALDTKPQIDISERLQSGEFLTRSELARIADAAQFPMRLLTHEEEQEAQTQVVNIKTVRMRRSKAANDVKAVCKSNHAIRMRYIADYLDFIANYYADSLPRQQRQHLASECAEACRRQFKIDHLCQLNFDQGSKAGCLAPGCG